MVTPAESGHGVMVTTQNINYCTTGMYRNALLTNSANPFFHNFLLLLAGFRKKPKLFFINHFGKPVRHIFANLHLLLFV